MRLPGAPKPTIGKLHDEIAVIGNEPEFRKSRLVDIRGVPVFDTPEHLAPHKEQRLVHPVFAAVGGRRRVPA
jgi:hypothetical protein